MESVVITIVGGREAIAKLEQMPQVMSRAMADAMRRSTMKVADRAVRQLRGNVLRVQTGRLWQSIQTVVSEDGSSGRVGTNVEYAAIHEYGGKTAPHLIFAPPGLALRFVNPKFVGPVLMNKKGAISRKARSGVVFTSWVVHPGATMPARPYLRPALADSKDDIRRFFRGAVVKALKGQVDAGAGTP